MTKMTDKKAKQFVAQFGFVLSKNQDGEYRLAPKLKMSDHDSRPVWTAKKNNERLSKDRAEKIAAYFDDLSDVEQVKDMHNRMKHEFDYHHIEQASVEEAAAKKDWSKIDIRNYTPTMTEILAFISHVLKRDGMKFKGDRKKFAAAIVAECKKQNMPHQVLLVVDSRLDSNVNTYHDGKQRYLNKSSDMFGNPEPLIGYVVPLSIMAMGVVVAAVGTTLNAKKSLGKYLKSRTFAKYANIPTKPGDTRELATANSNSVFMTFVGRKFSHVHIELSTTAQDKGGVRQRYIITVGGFDTVSDAGEVGKQVSDAMKDFAKRVEKHSETETAKTVAKKKSPAKKSARSAKIKTDNQKLAAALGRKGLKKLKVMKTSGEEALAYGGEIDGVQVRVAWLRAGSSRKIAIDIGTSVTAVQNFYDGSVLKAFEYVGNKLADRIDEIESKKNPANLDLDAMRKALSKLDPKFASHAPGYENPEHSTEKLSAVGKRLLKSLMNADGVKGDKHDRASYKAAVTLMFGKKDKDGNFVKGDDGKPVHEGLIKKLSINELKTVLYQMDKKFFDKNGGKVWAHLKTKNDVAGEILRKMEGSLRFGGSSGTDHRYKTKEDMWNTPDSDKYGWEGDGLGDRWMDKETKKAQRESEDERRRERNFQDDQDNGRDPSLRSGDTIDGKKGLFGRKKIRVLRRITAAIEEARAAAKKSSSKKPAKKAAKKAPAKRKPAPKKPAKKAAKKKSPAKKPVAKKKAPAKKAAGGASGGKAAMKTPKKPAAPKAPKAAAPKAEKKLAPVVDPVEVKTAAPAPAPAAAPEAPAAAPASKEVKPTNEVKPAKVAAMRLIQHASKLGVHPKVINEGFIGYMNGAMKGKISIDQATRPRTEAVVNWFMFRLGQEKVANAVGQFIGSVTKQNLIGFVERSVGASREEDPRKGIKETAAKKTSRKRPHDWLTHVPNAKLFDLKAKGKNIFDEGVLHYNERASDQRYKPSTIEARVFNLGRAMAEAIVASGVRADTLAFKRALKGASENASMLFAEHATAGETK